MDPTAGIVQRRVGSMYVSKRNLYSFSGNSHPDRRDVTFAQSFFVISCVVFICIYLIYCVQQNLQKKQIFTHVHYRFSKFVLLRLKKIIYLNNIVFIYFVTYAQSIARQYILTTNCSSVNKEYKRCHSRTILHTFSTFCTLI